MKNTTNLTRVAIACLIYGFVISANASDDSDTSGVKEFLPNRSHQIRPVKGGKNRETPPDSLHLIGRMVAQADQKKEKESGESKADEGKPQSKSEDKPANEVASSKAARAKGRELLVAASDKLKSYSSVRASIAEKVSIEGHSFTAKGSYLQGQNLRLRMEFAVELSGQKSSLLEICDGQILWSRHDLGAKDLTQITRRDVRQILQAAQKAEQSLNSADEKTKFNTTLIADLGLGGLPALLAAFSRDYDITRITQEKIDDRDVTVLEGSWNSKYLESWLGPKSKDKKQPALPAHVPDLVRIALDSESQFPRRIEYLKVVPGQSARQTLMTMDFAKVVFNGKLSNDDFVFIAPERPAPLDVTQFYLQRLAPPKKETKKPAE